MDNEVKDIEQLDAPASFQREEERRVRIESQLSNALDKAPIKAVGDRATVVHELIKRLNRDDHIEMTLADDGVLHCRVDGRRVALPDLLAETILTTPGLADQESLAASLRDKQPVNIQAKSDLDTKSKVAFIAAFGLSSYEALPLTRIDAPKEVKSKSDLKTTKAKCDYITQHGFSAWEALDEK